MVLRKKGNETPPYIGQKARDFAAITHAGDSLRLFDFLAEEETYVLLDFWGSWCHPCLVEMPNLAEVQNQYQDQLRIVGIAMDDDEALSQTIADYEISWPQVHQSSMAGSIIRDYHIFGFPTYFLIGPDSTIVEMGEALRGESLNQTLEALLQ